MSACANAIDPPSYLGMAPSAEASAGEAITPARQPSAVRHVSSNRVLGALAFQKVTGADVDPRTLTRRVP